MNLPVMDIADELLAAFAPGGLRRILLKAPTGSGKSTAVPKMLLERGDFAGRIVVVQPRRIAARMLAEYVASLVGSRVGEKVGYSVRFEKVYGPATRLIYVTDGVLQRWLAEEGGLAGVDCVLFDEFHERRLASDLALGRVLGLQEKRPDLRVGVMSATLEVAGLEDYLAPCAQLSSEGRRYPVTISYAGASERKRNRFGRMEEEALWDRVVKVLREQRAEEPATGDRILVFLPGVYEIRKTVERLQNSSVASGYEVLPLYSGLPPQAQRAAVARGGGPRIIVSTNVAETSLTIDGISLVIDSGLARVASFDPRRGLDSLQIQPISQAAAEQRAGRAGRTGPGSCVRLWSEADHGRRAAFELPEVRRVDLAEAVLYLKGAGYASIDDFPWLDEPTVEAAARAEELLRSLGAFSGEGLSEAGRLMASFPLHPRTARLLLAADEHDCVAEACFAAAVLQGEGVWAKKGGKERERFVEEGDWADFEADWRAVREAEKARFRVESSRSLGVQGRNAREALASYQQLCGMAKSRGLRVDRVRFEWNGEALAKAVVTAFADRLGVRLGTATLSCRLVGQRRGKLDETSVGRFGELFVACEVTEVEGREMTTYLKSCARVELAWLRDLFPHRLRESEGAEWDEDTRKVVARQRVLFDDLVVREQEGGTVSRELAGEILAEQVLAGKAPLKNWDAGVERWIARLNFLAATQPELEMPEFGEEERRFVIAGVCEGAASLREIRNREVKPQLREFLSAMQRASLESYAPEKVTLANGINSRVNYKEGEEPWIEEKVQRLYGVEKTPALPGGQKLVVKICAPNQRPWQVTKDLESFWESGFAQMKKDLAGRYPKHNWEGPAERKG
ncbi:ATP-dependent helicase HrpB [Roseibacillus ishigakijimensis]|uniref:ATP-dependent helicase HrpB n=1 Tax=Roseibacillus ishigakijimensis TaxID=454146 RepID=A0A934RR54_9BACT|nr:ATP-dependent helicase HrpB [Roseibacillus ishigakijimensis]MBK1835435.1 ATP-dependent helicase HrpB [Roseibacillus ishigakijimensis]